ncbi:MAG: glutamine-hydrolyzing carbamoyl-phosphate synthase small subunit [Gammaproteobacteria bacterium]
MPQSALLALEDGSLFHGRAVGIEGITTGEVVFNTAITGYQEILTDPSYCQQIVTLTQPHIGNVGSNPQDEESARVHAAGLVIRDLPHTASNWRQQLPLDAYLQQQQLVAIADIDTRRLTRLLRDKGAQNGCIMALPQIDQAAAVQAARDFPGLLGMDLVRQVSTDSSYPWRQGCWERRNGYTTPSSIPSSTPSTAPTADRWRVAAYDFGVKRNILRILVELGCEVTVVPATTPAAEVLNQSFDGVFLSNGPGDPEPCDYAITAIRELLHTGMPLFGICLGHQLLGLAAGATTVKMKFGHHGGNHPVQDLQTGQVLISSQNHGFAVAETGLPDSLEITHRSLFDRTVQGLRHKSLPAFGFQGHPEASPGPHDLRPLFKRFIDLMRLRARASVRR